MKKVKLFVFLFILAIVSFICTPQESIAQTNTGLNKYGKENMAGTCDDKMLIAPKHNCDPKMLISGRPGIDPGFLLKPPIKKK